MTFTASDNTVDSSDPSAFVTLKGPTVPRSHSFLPLRSGPPIYFPLPAPYDHFCLTGILPSDSLGPESTLEPSEDVDMAQEGESGKNGKSSNASRIEAPKRIREFGDVEGTGGWEYPVIRRIEEVKTLNTDAASTPAIIGTFSFKPQSSGSSQSDWILENVWICPEEREKGLATLVITYIIHSWFLKLPASRPRILAYAKSKDPPSSNFLRRLGFLPREEKTAVNVDSERSIDYIWRRFGSQTHS